MLGLPRIVWQPTHAPWPFIRSSAPRAGSPYGLLYGMFGTGVSGIVYAGIRSRGNAMKPACATGACGAVVGAAGACAAAAGPPDAADAVGAATPAAGFAAGGVGVAN